MLQHLQCYRIVPGSRRGHAPRERQALAAPPARGMLRRGRKRRVMEVP
jgi:hypothetical protein